MEPAAASWSREGSQADRGAPGTQEPRGTGTSLLALQAQPSRPGCVCFSGEVGAQRRSQSRKRELHARPQPHTGPSWVHTLVTGADGLGAGLRAACSFQRAPPPPPASWLTAAKVTMGATRRGHGGGGPWRPRPLHDQLDVCGAASPAQDRDKPSTSPACPGLRAPRPPEGMGITPPRQHTWRSRGPQTVLTPARCSLSTRVPLPPGQPCPQAPTQHGGPTVLAVKPARAPKCPQGPSPCGRHCPSPSGRPERTPLRHPVSPVTMCCSGWPGVLLPKRPHRPF